jgi:hypothetical protein
VPRVALEQEKVLFCDASKSYPKSLPGDSFFGGGGDWRLPIYLTAEVEGPAPEGQPDHTQQLSTRPDPILLTHKTSCSAVEHTHACTRAHKHTHTRAGRFPGVLSRPTRTHTQRLELHSWRPRACAEQRGASAVVMAASGLLRPALAATMLLLLTRAS